MLKSNVRRGNKLDKFKFETKRIFDNIRKGVWEETENYIIGEHADSILSRLIIQHEDNRLDFKENFPKDDKIVKFISAISNEGGGAIIVGISNNKTIVGIQNFEESSEWLFQKIKDSCNPVPKINTVKLVEETQRIILVIVISKPGRIPIQYKGSYYKRVGDTTDKMNSYEVKELMEELLEKDLKVESMEQIIDETSSLSLVSIDYNCTESEIKTKLENSDSFYNKFITNENNITTTKLLERKEVEDSLLHYLKKNSSILIEGHAGVGKTSLLARIIIRWLKAFDKDAHVLLIPKSSKSNSYRVYQLDDAILKEIKLLYEENKKILIIVDDIEKIKIKNGIIDKICNYAALLSSKRLGKEVIKNIYSIFPRYLYSDLLNKNPSIVKFSFVLEPDNSFTLTLLRNRLDWAVNNNLLRKELHEFTINSIENSGISDFLLGIPIYTNFLFTIIIEKCKEENVTFNELKKVFQNLNYNLSKNPQNLYSQWIKEVFKSMQPEIQIFMKACVELANITMARELNKKSLELTMHLIKSKLISEDFNIEEMHSKLINELKIALYNPIKNKYYLFPPHYYDYPRENQGIPIVNTSLFNRLFSLIEKEMENESNTILDQVGLLLDFEILCHFYNRYDLSESKTPIRKALELCISNFSGNQREYFREYIWMFVISRFYVGYSVIKSRMKKNTDDQSKDKGLKSIKEIKNEINSLLIEFLEIDAEYLPGLVLLGSSYLLEGDYIKALHYLEKIDYEKNVKHPLIALTIKDQLYRIGLIHYKLGNFSKSINYIKKLRIYDSENWEIYHFLGLLHSKNKEYYNSVINYEKSMKLNPKNPWIKYNLGYAYLQNQQPKNAIRIWTEVSEAFKDDFDLVAGLGTAYSTLKDYKNAIKYFKKANIINPNESQLLKSLINCFLEYKEFKNAKKYLLKYLKLVPDEAESYNILGKIELALGELRLAKIHFNKAKKLLENH